MAKSLKPLMDELDIQLAYRQLLSLIPMLNRLENKPYSAETDFGEADGDKTDLPIFDESDLETFKRKLAYQLRSLTPIAKGQTPDLDITPITRLIVMLQSPNSELKHLDEIRIEALIVLEQIVQKQAAIIQEPVHNDKIIPAIYRNEGSIKGEPLTAKFVFDRYQVSGSKLSRKGKTSRKKHCRCYLYKWVFIKTLIKT